MNLKYDKVSFKVKDFEGNSVALKGAFRRKALREGWKPDHLIRILKDCPDDSIEDTKEYLNQFCQEEKPKYSIPQDLAPVYMIVQWHRNKKLGVLAKDDVSAWKTREEAQDILDRFEQKHPQKKGIHTVKKMFCNALFVEQITSPRS